MATLYYNIANPTYPTQLMSTNGWATFSGPPFNTYIQTGALPNDVDILRLSRSSYGGTSDRTFYWSSPNNQSTNEISGIIHVDPYWFYHKWNASSSGTWLINSFSSSNNVSAITTYGVNGASNAVGQLNFDLTDAGSGASISTGSYQGADTVFYSRIRSEWKGGTTNTSMTCNITGQSDLWFYGNIIEGSGVVLGQTYRTFLRLSVQSSFTGTLNLVGPKSWSGGLTMAGGTVKIDNSESLGTTAYGTPTMNFSGGTLYFSGAYTLPNYLYSLSGSFIFDDPVGGATTNNMGSGNITLTGSTTISVTQSDSTYIFGGTISGSTFNLIKTGAGTLGFTGTATTLGDLTINRGVVELSNRLFFPSSGNINISGTSTALSGLENSYIHASLTLVTARDLNVSGDTIYLYGNPNGVSNNSRISFSALNGPATPSSSAFNMVFNSASAGNVSTTFNSAVTFNQPLVFNIQSNNNTVTLNSSFAANSLTLTSTGAGRGTVRLFGTNTSQVLVDTALVTEFLSGLTFGPNPTVNTQTAILRANSNLRISFANGSTNTTLNPFRFLSIDSTTNSTSFASISSDAVNFEFSQIRSTGSGGYVKLIGSGTNGKITFSGVNSPYNGSVFIDGVVHITYEKAMPLASFVTSSTSAFNIRNTVPTSNYIFYCNTLTLNGGTIFVR